VVDFFIEIPMLLGLAYGGKFARTRPQQLCYITFNLLPDPLGRRQW